MSTKQPQIADTSMTNHGHFKLEKKALFSTKIVVFDVVLLKIYASFVLMGVFQTPPRIICFFIKFSEHFLVC